MTLEEFVVMEVLLVPELFRIEKYESLFQMVSEVQGKLKKKTRHSENNPEYFSLWICYWCSENKNYGNNQ